MPIPVAILISAVTRSACGVRTAFGLGADVPAHGRPRPARVAIG